MPRLMLSHRRRIVSTLAMAGVTVLLALGVLSPPQSVGQSTRTFISGVGNDADPCSRTAPCRTFAGAFNKTAPGGEINCLDPGGYGGLTINKSIMINCRYTEGGSLVAGAGVNGITVNFAATDVAVLRGLDMTGATTATNGIRILSGGAVHIEDTVIRNFKAQNGTGILVAPTGALDLFISDSVVSNNGTAQNGGGILVRPTAAGTAKITIVRSLLQNNPSGLFVDGTATSATTNAINLDIRETDSSGNIFHGFAVLTDTTRVTMMIDSSTASHNLGGAGIQCNGAGCLVHVGRSYVTDNLNGTQPLNGGVIASYQTNQIRGNSNNGSRTNITQE